MQTTNSVLSILDQLLVLRDNFQAEVLKCNDYVSKLEKLQEENKILKNKCDKLEKQSVEHKEEVESLRRVSIIKNMSKQVHDLKSQNEILSRKVNHYKSIADTKTDSSILSASNFDGGNDKEESIEIELETNSHVEEYKITESLARLLNIPIETEITSKAAVSRVSEYIEDNSIFDSKNKVLKYDYKLYFFLNIDSALNKNETSSLLKNLCKIVKKYGLVTDNSSKSTMIKSENSVKRTIEDYLKKTDIKSDNYISSDEAKPDSTLDIESDDEEEELEVKKIGKRYYYVSVDTNIVYKAVKVNKGQYDVGKRLGIYQNEKLIKD